MNRLLFRLFAILIVLGTALPRVHAQIDTVEGHFRYTPEPFSPPIKALIEQYEGFPCTPMEAPDIEGQKHTIGGYRGKVTLLFFWRVEPNRGDQLFGQLNDIDKKYREKVQILSFADEPKNEVVSFLEAHPVQFPVIANAKMLSEAVYASELGYPRIFVIDEYGIIKLVLPEVVLTKNNPLEHILALFL